MKKFFATLLMTVLAFALSTVFAACDGLFGGGGGGEGGNGGHSHKDGNGDGMCDICGIRVDGPGTEIGNHPHMDKDDNGRCDYCDIELGGSVLPQVSYLTLDEDSLTLEIGDTKSLKVTVYPQSANGVGLVWNSSNDRVATVKNGIVTAVGEGAATIYVTAEDEFKQSAECAVVVNPAPVKVSGVSLDKDELTIEAGKTDKLTASVSPLNADNKNVSWSSSDESIVTVENGVVTAVAEGEATVTVTTQDGNKTAECAVTVIPAVVRVTRVSLNKTSLNFYEGESETLTAAVSPNNADDKSIVWSSSDEYVATVVDGEVTARHTGTATITVTTVDGNKTATCTVVVGNLSYRTIIVDGVTVGYAVAGMGSYKGDNIIIPAKYSGKPVTEIDKEAFKDKTTITSVTIPDSVTKIGDNAFGGCTGIRYAAMPVSAFPYISVSNLNTLVITGGDSIEASAFKDNRNLTSITIPASITSIGEYAFRDCKNLSTLNITDISKWCEISFGDNYSNPLNSSAGATMYLNGEVVTDLVVPEGTQKISSQAFCNCNSLTSVVIPDSVTVIGNGALQGCDNLAKITVGKGVTSIGGYAFWACNKLEEVHISDLAKWCAIGFADGYSNPLNLAHNLYLNGKLVEQLVISDGITEIGANAFTNCTSLTSVMLPASLTDIGANAFNGCTNIEIAVIPPEFISSIPPNKLKTVYISNGVTEIGANAFKNYSKLTEIVISIGVTTIGAGAFSGCSNLETLTVSGGNTKYHSEGNCIIETESKTLIAGCKTSVIPDDGSVTAIGDYAFYGCTEMTEIVIPEGVTSISIGAFGGCTNLASITIPDSIEEIATDALANCNKIVNAAMPVSAWPKVSENMWRTIATLVLTSGESIEYGLLSHCGNLTSVTLPDELTSISGGAFRYSSSLTSITIPKNVTSIGSGAFEGCSGLTSLTVSDENAVYHSEGNCIIETESKTLIAGCKTSVIPDDGSVTSIGDYAFHGCSTLESIVIPEDVTSIGSHAFYGCKGMTEIVISEGVTFIGSDAFFDCDALTSVIIPESVTSIGSDAFGYCNELASVTVLCGAASFGRDAFYMCEKLEDVHVADIAKWCTNSYSSQTANPLFHAKNLYLNGDLAEDLVIPDGVTEIKEYAFYILNSIKTITLPDSITSIKQDAFYYCTSLEEVHIADLSKWFEVSFANSYANPLNDGALLYVGETLIEDLVIPEEVTTILSYTFYGCGSFKTITIDSNVTTIERNAFNSDCATVYCEVALATNATKPSGWEYVWCPSSMAVVWDYKNNDRDKDGYLYVFIGGIKYALKDGIAQVTVQPKTVSGAITIPTTVTYGETPDNQTTYQVTAIKDGAFRNCRKLTSIVIPDGISLGTEVFYGCSNLTSATLPGDITSVPKGTFYRCTSLAEIEIPDSVTEICESAFRLCTSLTSITIPEGVTDIGMYVFYGSGLTSITIPVSVTSFDDYSFYVELEYINYNGTKSQWYAIKKTRYWTTIKTYVVCCTDGEINYAY